jgi:hypothetical protein
MLQRIVDLADSELRLQDTRLRRRFEPRTKLVSSKPARCLIADATPEDIRLLDRATAKCPRDVGRVHGDLFASRARGCLRLRLCDWRGKHLCTLWSAGVISQP